MLLIVAKLKALSPLFFVFVWTWSFSAYGIGFTTPKVSDPWRLELSIGYSHQSFANVSNDIQRFSYGIGAYYSPTWWLLGVDYISIPGIGVHPFIFQNGTKGQYTVNFKRYQLHAGYTRGKLRATIIGGSEEVDWVGDPELGFKKHRDSYYGLHISWDAYRKVYATGPNFTYPLHLTYLIHPERQYEFANYPSDTVTADRGGEFQLGGGIAYDF